jgi:hypothetical protein
MIECNTIDWFEINIGYIYVGNRKITQSDAVKISAFDKL